jgi:dinuclear metal center YbgI/SA1388 family protein
LKTVPLKKLVSFLDSELALSEFPKDESANGLQVEGKPTVEKIGIAVDACEYVFEKASRKGVDFLLVHHGLIWGGIRSIRGVLMKRIKSLMDSGISLYACHLPLDWHPVYGNNARILKLLSVRRMGEFGEYHGKKIGCWGRTAKPLSLDEFRDRIDTVFNTKSLSVDFGRKVRKVGVVSGGGWSAIHDAEKYGIDTFLTGEPSHSAYTLAEEMKINLIFSGHYATETVGVKAVGEMLGRRFGLKIEFIDHPTGM